MTAHSQISQDLMKLLFLGLIALIFILLGVTILLGIWRTLKVQNSPFQQEFLRGKVSPGFNGFYKGTVTSIKTNWQGKKFIASKSAGINIFKDQDGEHEKYPFKTYTGKGLQDSINVLKIDYSNNKDPWWLRFILDELVEASPGKYLGKVHIQIFPGLGFTLGYFRLEKNTPSLP